MKHPSEMSDNEILRELKFLDSLNKISVDNLLDGSFNIDMDDDLTITARGELFDTSKLGIIANIVDEVYLERVEVRKKEKLVKLAMESGNGDKKQLEKQFIQLYNEQLGIKILINSLYGAFSNQYFRFYDERIAESITLTGQLTIKWIEKELNLYFNKLLKTETIDYILAIDTDSVVGDTLIDVNGIKIKIENYYNSINNNFIKNDEFNNNYIKKVNDKHITPSINLNGELEYNKIKYIMKHKVIKKMYKITDNKGNSVIVTEDHSIVVKNKKLIKYYQLNQKNYLNCTMKL